MVRPIGIVHVSESISPIPLAIGLFVSVSLLVGLCAKHARKYASKTSDPNTAFKSSSSSSQLPYSPKQLIATISHKASMLPLIHGNKRSASDAGVVGGNSKKGSEDSSDGLWQKAILMGERCQPPEFSGVIYYDYSGNRIPEMPKSPRATSMSPLKIFSFPAGKNDNYRY
ncbi:hypothetical protein ACP275_12G082800 [Erythranthe tilingii]